MKRTYLLKVADVSWIPPLGTRCWVIVTQDGGTANLTRHLADSLQRATGARPHVIINLLHRSRLDANRHKDQAAFNDPIASASVLPKGAFDLRTRLIM